MVVSYLANTIQSLAFMEGCAVEDYLQRHPGKTLRDAYQQGAVSYRSIVMAPGHLVEKWKEEIEKEIPYATATIVHSLGDLISLKERGKKPKGREFYIISKDTAKLDTMQSPIPVQIKKRHFAADICKDCFEDEKQIIFKKGSYEEGTCPSCKGHNFMPHNVSDVFFKGLVCPCCGELLIVNKNYDSDKLRDDEYLEKSVLTPKSFSSGNRGNAMCYHCGQYLWGSHSKPLLTGEAVMPKPSKWYKVTHFTNHTHRGKTSAFVLRGHEEEYASSIVTREGWAESSREFGPRKVSLAKYIKQHLNGWFDYAVMDEVHKYLGNSAQSVAAHHIIKASKFTLGLTGTISNGTAEAFFNLFWMLEPKRLLDMGYTYGQKELMRFCKQYGCVETVYEATKNDLGRRNVMSRGKQITAPRVKPGISPVIFGKLLMDRCLFLDISDLSKYLPKFSEKVILCDVPKSLSWDYEHVIDTLKDESKNGSGMAVLSTMLQYGLSYLDKPYGRLPIMNPFKKESLIIKPNNHDEYSTLDNLLPKEEVLIDLVKQEITEGRNCFIYASFTGLGETNVTYRLQQLIEAKCNLRGRVCILQSSSPAASKREEYFHKKASEGIKVFITNPKNVETGLDFCFEYNGTYYNYPTLIFYQTGYELATIWQAGRRAYRLNQRKECRNYYIAYEGTLQAAALEIMAKKQSSTAAIQGHFSTEGLSAMAKGVDARAQLAAALSKNDMSSRESLENMFDALSVQSNDDDGYNDFVKSPSFYEVMGYGEAEISALTNTTTSSDLFDGLLNTSLDTFANDLFSSFGVSNGDKPTIDNSFSMQLFGGFSFEGQFDIFGAFSSMESEPAFETGTSQTSPKVEKKAEKKPEKKKAQKKKAEDDSLLSIFDLAV